MKDIWYQIVRVKKPTKNASLDKFINKLDERCLKQTLALLKKLALVLAQIALASAVGITSFLGLFLAKFP